MVKEECLSMDDLKEGYNECKKKYSLPDFNDLNKLFDIEDVDSETEFLLRKIRRTISDKVAGYLRFIEIILNPSNAPMFFFKLIKKLDPSDKQTLIEIQEILGNFEVEIVGLDLDYDEKKEADFISKIYQIFDQEIRMNLYKIVDKLGNGKDKIGTKENNGSYFG